MGFNFFRNPYIYGSSTSIPNFVKIDQRTLWDGHYGTDTMGRTLWDGHYGTDTMGRTLWDGHYGTDTMGRTLWDGHYGKSIFLYAIECTTLKSIYAKV